MVNTSTPESRGRRFMDQIPFRVIFRVSLVFIYFFISLVSVSFTYAYTYTYQYRGASVHYPHKRLSVLKGLVHDMRAVCLFRINLSGQHYIRNRHYRYNHWKSFVLFRHPLLWLDLMVMTGLFNSYTDQFKVFSCFLPMSKVDFWCIHSWGGKLARWIQL